MRTRVSACVCLAVLVFGVACVYVCNMFVRVCIWK